MNISEPEPWNLSDTKFKVSNIETSSSDDSSDDELFSKTKTIRKKKFKKLVKKEEITPD
jgi:hypothetical protein